MLILNASFLISTRKLGASSRLPCKHRGNIFQAGDSPNQVNSLLPALNLRLITNYIDMELGGSNDYFLLTIV